ncbi:MAG: tRNA modification GTPase, partial [Simkaniaceae bacterium]
AILQAWVDFPEEGLEFASKEELLSDLQNLKEDMSALHNSFHDGKLLSTSFSLCLLGAPNVGKSSLMNALTGKDRAIVTHIPGTTRDILEEEVQIAGLTFRLIDTAGIRETDEIVELEGVRRSHKAAKNADLILLVFDVTQPSPISIDLPEKKTIAIWNKIDLDHSPLPDLPFSHQVQLSAKEGLGIASLKEAIHRVVWHEDPPSKEEVILTNERHYQALGASIKALTTVIQGLSTSISPEFLVSDMRLALKELGTIIGMNITEEVLSAIFSKFCVGK